MRMRSIEWLRPVDILELGAPVSIGGAKPTLRVEKQAFDESLSKKTSVSLDKVEIIYKYKVDIKFPKYLTTSTILGIYRDLQTVFPFL